ncbi:MULTISPECIES: hypothetical protein [Dickeya]|uniref:hypothetical protein n=1 Tax=Dickeya TaxID=204037 RepID=UPI000532D9BF|nr:MULTISPECIES: hypothetical protein [Dickeya]TYL41074.1 hypothetical protein FDP13_19855 [Dickeya sp. ws52]
MKNNSIFESIKGSFISILEEKPSSPVDKNELFIDYSAALDDRFEKYLDLLRAQEMLLTLAKNRGDEFAMQSALLRLRTHAMSLSSFFNAIVEDAEIILRLETWPELPEGYKLPEYYNVPD